VLEELDRERTQRAELESTIRRLQEEAASTKHQSVRQVASIKASPEYISLQTESQGYLQLLDALTVDRPAFAAAAAQEQQQQQQNQMARGFLRRQPTDTTAKTLPLHVIRLLEVLPWDERTQPHLFAQECVFEWQVRSSIKTWNKTLRQFPTFFKTLPIVMPQPGNTVEEKGLGILNRSGAWNRPPKQGVLTTMAVDQILNIDTGYPLPQDGGSWQWIGGWRIETRPNETDEQGWSYSYNPNISGDMNNEHYRDSLETPPKGAPNLVHRRRKWTRTRILVDYPHASESTRQYLKVLAHKAASQISSEKMSEQLVKTKMALTTLEQEHLNLKEVSDRRVRKLTKELESTQQALKKKEELLASYQKGDNGNVVKTKAKEQVKEFGSVVSQWVSDTVTKTRNRTMSTSSLPQQAPSDSAHDGNTIDSEDEDRPEEDAGGRPELSSAASPPVASIPTTAGDGGGVGGDDTSSAAIPTSASTSTAAAATTTTTTKPKQQLIDWNKMNMFDKLKKSGDGSGGGALASWLKSGSSTASIGKSSEATMGKAE